MIEHQNRVEFILHDLSTGVETVVPDDTDISIELGGELERNQIQLFRSHTTREQQDLPTRPYLSPPGMSPILRTALLARYIYVTGISKSKSLGKTKATNITAFDKAKANSYSMDERLEAASYSYGYAQEINLKHSWLQDVIKSYGKAEIIERAPPCPPLTTLRSMEPFWLTNRIYPDVVIYE